MSGTNTPSRCQPILAFLPLSCCTAATFRLLQVASKETALLLAAIRDPPSNAPPVSTMLPTKSYCRTFFEALPALYRFDCPLKVAHV